MGRAAQAGGPEPDRHRDGDLAMMPRGKSRDSTYTREQIAAMSRSSRLGGWVAAQYPWVVQLYRAGLSYAEIAAKLPELNETAWGPRMAEAAVGYAVRMLTDDEELQG